MNQASPCVGSQEIRSVGDKIPSSSSSISPPLPPFFFFLCCFFFSELLAGRLIIHKKATEVVGGTQQHPGGGGGGGGGGTTTTDVKVHKGNSRWRSKRYQTNVDRVISFFLPPFVFFFSFFLLDFFLVGLIPSLFCRVVLYLARSISECITELHARIIYDDEVISACSS